MQVLNRGDVVGTLSDEMPDMWFLEGAFTPSDTQRAREFVAAAESLDLNQAMTEPTRAIRAELRESPEQSGTTFIVMSLSEGRLFGRRVFDPAAVEWTLANVPE
jgi:hypothetical protein